MAPDVCDKIVYDGRKYRVIAWIKKVPKTDFLKTEFFTTGDMPKDNFSDILGDILIESSADEEGSVRVWCSREEAQFVSGVGVGGCMAPIEECEVVGRVPWSDEHIAEAKKRAISLIGRVI